MRHLLLLILVLAATESAAQAPKGKPGKGKEPPVFPVMGTIQRFQESTGELTLRVTTRWLEPDPGAQATYRRQQMDLMRRQARLQTIRDPRQRAQEMQQLQREIQQLQQTGARLVRMKEKQQDVKLTLAEGAKIHTLAPAEEFDDKGAIRVPTAEELKKRRGDTKLPGFPAEREVLLDTGRLVQVLARPRVGSKEETKKEKKKDQMPDLEATFVLVGPLPPTSK